jgi:hypothetical protein
MTIAGATDADVFRACVGAVWCPTLRAGDRVVADGPSAHKAPGVQAAVAAAGARLHSPPPYPPDLHPIERCRSKTKARTREALEAAVTRALATVTASDARARFAHGGYVLH